MSAKLLLSTALAMLLSQAAFAQDACKEDKDCSAGQVCILAMNPHACKAPQAAGAPCKRDVVCASGKCDMSAGVCK
jgi:hypothetical protein